MKKITLFIALLSVIGIKSYSQIDFEKGYFIDESGNRIECLIRNMDWRNNPVGFEYKVTQDEKIHTASVSNIKEFGVYEVLKYIRAIVRIDRSGDKINNMNSNRNPDFQEEQLFLKVLIEGKASLFHYNEGNLTRFFYKLNDSEISQLVYKRFLLNGNVAQNNLFRQQLLLDMECQDITLKDVESLSYEQKDLERFFIKYNKATDSGFLNYQPEVKEHFTILTIRPGLSYSSFSIQNSMTDSRDTDFGNKTNFRIGIETEFILPFNKNKWSILIEPTYQYFKAEERKEVSNVAGGIRDTRVKYQSVDFPVGVRHYFFLDDRSKIFANVSFLLSFTIHSTIDFRRIDGSLYNSLEIEPGKNLALGVGYKLINRHSLELRCHTNRQLLSNFYFWDSPYTTISLIYGYSILK
jgi:hypothetical protein